MSWTWLTICRVQKPNDTLDVSISINFRHPAVDGTCQSDHPTSGKQVESRSVTCSDSDVFVTFHHRCLCMRPWKMKCWNLDIWCIHMKTYGDHLIFNFRTISRLPASPLISSLQGSLVCMCCCGWSILVEVYQVGCCPMHQQFNIYIYIWARSPDPHTPPPSPPNGIPPTPNPPHPPKT